MYSVKGLNKPLPNEIKIQALSDGVVPHKNGEDSFHTV